MNDITQLLCALEQGDPHAAGRLLPLVYDELRKLAAQRMVQEQPGQTLQPTALVHEAHVRLVGQGDPGWAHDEPASLPAELVLVVSTGAAIMSVSDTPL
jgi:hypothetical protein